MEVNKIGKLYEALWNFKNMCLVAIFTFKIHFTHTIKIFDKLFHTKIYV